MARARNIKPAFFQNDKLGELNPLARLVFIGMWTIADFKGCIEYRPKMLKVQILPYDLCDFEQIVITLEQARFIRFYAEQGNRYIKIVNFEKHQNPHKNEREAGSCIPDISENNIVNNELTQDGTKPDIIGTTRADSLFPLPDSLNPLTDCPASPVTKKILRKNKSSLPDDFSPTESHQEFAGSKGLSLSKELEKFRYHHEEKSTLSGNWNSSFSKWLHNAVEFGRKNVPKSQNVQEARLDTARQIFGGQNGTNRQTFDIDAIRTIEGDGESISKTIPRIR